MSTTRLETYAWVTVKNVYIALVKDEINGIATYTDEIYEARTIKQIGLTPKNANLDIYASGALLDTVNKNQGTDIALDVVALPNWLAAKLQGSEQYKGGTFENVKDYPIKFAFGYHIETNNGGYHVAWCPLCKLQPPSRTAQTSTESLTEPKETYTIKCMPTVTGDIDFEYNSNDAEKAGFVPLPLNDFFKKPFADKEEFKAFLDTAKEIEEETPVTP